MTTCTEANARLIAAAHDLLEACQRCLDFIDDDESNQASGVRHQIQEAIAKATKARA